MNGVLRPRASLDDRWNLAGEPVLLSGVQALVRLPLLQRQLDEAAGHDTAGFVSGYRGSPLGTYDKELARQAERLREAGIVVRPGLNEDLAATAVWGTQQVGLVPSARHAGVFGIWYGKGPGVDRSGDALRHANSAGTAPLGGVLALSGDDPSAKSSTVTNASDHAFVDFEIPFLDPAGVAEVLEFGLKGIALSRASGLWAGMKCVADTMDASATLRVDPVRWTPAMPAVDPGPDGLHIRLRDTALAQEARLRGFRLPAAIAFARANALNPVVLDAPRARLGIAARGKAYAALRQAMLDLGIDEAAARLLGLRLWKVGLVWPLDAGGARDFARGLERVLVVEDRRALLEPMLRDALYALDDRPQVIGKRDAEGGPLLSELTELDAAAIARALLRLLPAAELPERAAARAAELDALAGNDRAPAHLRAPWFCPGCPHNTSTKLPEGSRGMAGIGCHYMVNWMDRNTELFTQMGGEGMPWLGAAPFTTERHVFVNLGDGTYSHSGSLAIRAAIAARADMTYKILVNGAVAMTGGQAPEGDTSVAAIAAQVSAEGAARVVVVSDDPDRHRDDPRMPRGVAFHHRDRLDAVQRELRGVQGVTVLIYDQECATERRRHRKRGAAAPAPRRVVINPRICEDCGDCSAQSNCLAVEPVQTAFGRKRRIDQSACNQDYSCVKGFCPSFVSLEGAEVAKHRPTAQGNADAAGHGLPDPVLPELRDGAWNVLIAGVGGGGVTALSAILGMAAHLEGRPVRTMDQLGLAQKGGGVYGMLRLGAAGASPDTLAGPRIGAGQADLLVAADMVVAHGRSARPLLGRGRSTVVLNAELAPTAAFVQDGGTRYDTSAMLDSLRDAAREVVALPAAARVTEALGDAIFLNVFLLGVAFQRGALPLGAEAIDRALALNGAEVESNRAAFALGRAAALEAPAAPPGAETLDALVARRIDDLTAYQNARYARDYAEAVARVRQAEAGILPNEERLSRAVAVQLHRLMAYKDEYEVARLHSNPEWRRSLAERFAGTRAIRLNLAPPVMARRDPDTGLPVKRSFGPWMLRAMGLLRHGKVLRGTVLDPFGRTGERRTERALIAEFRAGLEAMLARLDAGRHAAICDWVEAWGGIRGFGHVKARHLEATRPRLEALARAAEADPAPSRQAA